MFCFYKLLKFTLKNSWNGKLNFEWAPWKTWLKWQPWNEKKTWSGWQYWPFLHSFYEKKTRILDERNREINGNFKMGNRWSPWRNPSTDFYDIFIRWAIRKLRFKKNCFPKKIGTYLEKIYSGCQKIIQFFFLLLC